MQALHDQKMLIHDYKINADTALPSSGVLSLHVGHQIDHSVGVAKLIVIPRHQLHKSWRQLDPSLGIKDRRPGVSQEVSGHDHVLRVAKDTLHIPRLACLLNLLADLLIGSSL